MSSEVQSEINDDYPTCQETYVTLRVYHEKSAPDVVSSALRLEPTDSQRVGESYERARGVIHTYTLSGWFLCSKKHVDSYDTAKHLDWLLRQIQDHQEAFEELRSEGWRLDIACFWDSHAGHGGPTLSPDILRRLAPLGIEVWFDIYFNGAYHGIQHSKQANATPPNT